eukprot:scaffold7885_cov403-Prasinococcus_capsulatus_cf.AAC.5
MCASQTDCDNVPRRCCSVADAGNAPCLPEVFTDDSALLDDARDFEKALGWLDADHAALGVHLSVARSNDAWACSMLHASVSAMDPQRQQIGRRAIVAPSTAALR